MTYNIYMINRQVYKGKRLRYIKLQVHGLMMNVPTFDTEIGYGHRHCKFHLKASSQRLTTLILVKLSY